MPLLNAFMNEIKRVETAAPEFPKRMVEYLLGKFDFYKVIAVDSRETTEIQSFNLRGTLNRPSSEKAPDIIIPIAELPDEMIAVKMKKNSKTTVELYFNNGWQFNFRLHNASEYIENSLKFDIQFVGMPTEIVLLSCHWN